MHRRMDRSMHCAQLCTIPQRAVRARVQVRFMRMMYR